MEELSTQNYLVSFLYQETSLKEEIALKNQMSYDADLKAEYETLRTAKQALPKALFNPSDSILDKILKYSQETATEHYC